MLTSATNDKTTGKRQTEPKPGKKHWVGLYYPNDSDGDTFFFDNDLNVIHREPPERGKIILFDGSTYHSSSSPTKEVRFSLNINYEYN